MFGYDLIIFSLDAASMVVYFYYLLGNFSYTLSVTGTDFYFVT